MSKLIQHILFPLDDSKEHHDNVCLCMLLQGICLTLILFPLDESKEHHDNVCLCMLLQGICLRHLGRTEDAEHVLRIVADRYVEHRARMS